nr:DUF2871 domain-containing protein [Corynebacterium lactis]
MRKLFTAAAVYLGLGLFAGLFYREFTRAMDFTEQTQLNTLHTHLFVLGTFFFLIALGLDKAFNFSSLKGFSGWFVLHNVGIVWTIGFMVANGIVHVVSGPEAWGAMYAGMAGIGHIILTVSFIQFFVLLNKALKKEESARRAAA